MQKQDQNTWTDGQVIQLSSNFVNIMYWELNKERYIIVTILHQSCSRILKDGVSVKPNAELSASQVTAT